MDGTTLRWVAAQQVIACHFPYPRGGDTATPTNPSLNQCPKSTMPRTSTRSKRRKVEEEESPSEPVDELAAEDVQPGVNEDNENDDENDDEDKDEMNPETEDQPVEEEEEQDEDEDMGGEEEGEEDAEDEEEETAMVEAKSPDVVSPKGMSMRSGKRKRRRSPGTTGLTPTDDGMPTKRKKKKEEEVEEQKEVLPEKQTTTATFVDDATAPAGSNAGRPSILSMDSQAVAVANMPEPMPTPEEDSNRRLFDDRGTPTDDSQVEPPPSTDVPVAVEPPTVATTEEAPAHLAPESSPAKTETPEVMEGPENKGQETEEPFETEETPSPQGSIPLRIIFCTILLLLFRQGYPACQSLADYLLPIPELNLTQLTPAEPVSPTAEPLPDAPDSVVATLHSLERLLNRCRTKRASVDSQAKIFDTTKSKLQSLIEEKKEASAKLEALEQVQQLLTNLLEQDDIDEELWEEARSALRPIGKALLDTSAMELWDVPDVQACAGAEPIEDQPIDAEELERSVTEAREISRKTAQTLMESPETNEKVRVWIREQIASMVEGQPGVAEALAALDEDTPAKATHQEGGGLSADQIQQMVNERLEMERADRTGVYDFASVFNGARVLQGGNPGTSKSLIDDLPIMNRLLHGSQLQFYGNGPEAAITPTYPPDSLGQCWSFQQASLEELRKRRLALGVRGHDGHRHGNYGTLTVQLAEPVEVTSVVIEHPPKGLTDQTSSAIKAFRVVGYDSTDATSNAYNLGSFQYDIDGENGLQEFEVAREVAGEPIPPLQSITLAIDSNWGHDYACLYRFRVHGERAELEEDDE
eukprot:Nitzschia sp. Nitz4//scaffold13_size275219//261504//264013//NITZ4_000929-RA/size275219-augustus-gene-0.244-mRNA-1//1//CDS//3329536179//7054//frame0